MNFRHTTSKYVLPVAAALLAIAAGPADADELDPRLTVTFITDAPAGEAIGKEQYDLAVRKLENTNGRGINDFYIANNLCVSYLKVGEAAKARDACEVAVARIKDIVKTSRSSSALTSTYQTMLAIALSNRGVVYIVNDMPGLARSDFEAAIDIRTGLAQPKINLARLAELAPATA